MVWVGKPAQVAFGKKILSWLGNHHTQTSNVSRQRTRGSASQRQTSVEGNEDVRAIIQTAFFLALGLRLLLDFSGAHAKYTQFVIGSDTFSCQAAREVQQRSSQAINSHICYCLISDSRGQMRVEVWIACGW